MLRNPTFTKYGTAYPNNIYTIENRYVEPKTATTDVIITLVCYTDDTKAYRVSESDWRLEGLTTDPAELTPTLYQAQLIGQHGNEALDGSLLSEFEVL